MQRAVRFRSVIPIVVWPTAVVFTAIVPEDPVRLVSWLLFTFALLACGGLLVARRWPRTGGAIAVAACIAYALVNMVR